MTARMTWMDTLRGAAILLLLFWHAAGVPALFGWEMPEWLYLLNEVFLPWRMPTLMFLSGLLLSLSLRKPPGEYYAGKARSILWPYILWGALHILTFPGFSGSLLHPATWITTGYLWFIFYLLVYYCVAPLVTRAPWWIVLPAAAAGGLVFDNVDMQRGCYFAVFFFGGHYLRGRIAWFSGMPRRWFAIGFAVAIGFTVVSLWLTAVSGVHFFMYETLVIPLAGVLILLSVRVAAWLDERRSDTHLVRALRWTGARSIVFYLTHFPIMTLISVLAAELVPIGLWIVPVNWVAAVAAGIGLGLFANRAPVSWLFRAPFGWRKPGRTPRAGSRRPAAEATVVRADP